MIPISERRTVTNSFQRAISLFESTNPSTKVRYEIQLKGAGTTPYSRFADGKAVLRSSIREFVVSECTISALLALDMTNLSVALNALNIPSTRALALTLTPHVKIRRETLEPGAIVTRFAQSWLRIGTFDILRARGDRTLIRKLATYIGENVFSGWESLPAVLSDPSTASQITNVPPTGVPASEIQGPSGLEENRFTRLYRHICRLNALTVAKWQAYAFTNGVLNTDNTSIMGLSLDFGPFAFLDNFDPNYTPNHDDHMLRYSYRNQPSIIWWNLVRLGESLGELIGAGAKVDDEEFISNGVNEDWAPELVARAEDIIKKTGDEYRSVFLAEYRRLMTLRLGLRSQKESDFKSLISESLDTMEALDLDFNHFFRRLSSVNVADLDTEDKRLSTATRFFHHEGVTGGGNTEESAKTRVASWLSLWRKRVIEDWGSEDSSSSAGSERQKAMKSVNPKFIPRSFILDELIKRLTPTSTRKPDKAVLERVMNMALNPFDEEWGGVREEEERWCGDVPRLGRGMMCSCSS